jgi:hypothetical protein
MLNLAWKNTPKWLWTNPFVGMTVIFIGTVLSVAGEAPPRTAIDTLWEQHMLEGTFVVMTLEDSQTKASAKYPSESIEPKNDEPTFPSGMSHPISIEKLGEGFFGNGGWVLAGGLLRRVRDGSSTFELYGKKIVRQFSYFPFPPHRDPPQEVSYEFFLLHRKPGVPLAQVIRKWTFSAENVIQKNPNYPSVQVTFGYDKTTQSATLAITGLRNPFKERVDLVPKIEAPAR